MNRRGFFKTTALSIGATALAPVITLATEPELPLYKQFVWVDTPCFLLFKHDETTNQIVRKPFVIKTERLKKVTSHEVDFANGNKIITAQNAKIADPILFEEIKRMGYTHLYCIVSSIVDLYRGPNNIEEARMYFVRGVKASPEYMVLNK